MGRHTKCITYEMRTSGIITQICKYNNWVDTLADTRVKHLCYIDVVGW